MTRSNLIQSAILAWIVTILLSIASGPMMKMYLSKEDYPNGLSVHKKLQNLNITTSSDFDGNKNTAELFFVCLTSFLACVLCLSIILTILIICPEGFCRKILYSVFLFLFTAAFIGLTIGSSFLYVNLYDEQIDPYNTSDLHGQMTSSLKDNFRSDNFTTGTKMSNEWNHLFIDFECCGVNKVVGTTNDFDHTSWCTTQGSCQATASQIPKTCCIGLTEYDYQNARTACHSSVNAGEYYDKGCFSVIKKEVIKERIRFHSYTDDILKEGLRVILVMVLVTIRCLTKGIFHSECGDYIEFLIKCVHYHGQSFDLPLPPHGKYLFSFIIRRNPKNKNRFFSKVRYPNVLGALKFRLSENEPSYVCRKGLHAHNVQAVSDASLRFTDLVCKWPGAVHDSFVFKNLNLNYILGQECNGWLLGDSGLHHSIRPF